METRGSTIKTVFETKLIDRVQRWLADWSSSIGSLTQNLSDFGISGNEKKAQSDGDVIDTLAGGYNEFGYFIRRTGVHFTLHYLWHERASQESSEDIERKRDDVQARSEGFFAILSALGVKGQFVKPFPKAWRVKWHGSAKTVGEAARRVEWIKEHPEDQCIYPGQLFFWSPDKSYKKFFSVRGESWKALTAYLDKYGLQYKELKPAQA